MDGSMTQARPGMAQDVLMEVEGLTVSFGKAAPVVKDVSFTLKPGRTLAVVGESGSGKSVTSLALMGLVPGMGGRIDAGRISLRGEGGKVVDLARLPEPEMRRRRGSDLAMIFQEPMTALNPVFSVGEQIIETILEHRGGTRAAARAEAADLLRKVRLPDPEAMLKRYPHQLSGGMRQRVVIAMALSCRPRVLIADEPTTALDVTVQAQIMELIRTLQRETGVSVVFITHDMGVVAEMADEVMVMYRGEMVETGPAAEVFARPKHAYTQMLLAAVPDLGSQAGEPLPVRRPVTVMEGGVAREIGDAHVQDTVRPGAPVLRADNICARFDVRHSFFGRPTHRVHAAENVSFDLHAGETLAIVGESGSGKSTIGRLVQRLVPLADGRLVLDGRDYRDMGPAEVMDLRRQVHTIWQDPMASLNPRLTVGQCITEPMVIHGLGGTTAARMARARELLEKVGLSAADADRFPHAFSGGQRQRICIARALAAEARIIIADEAVSALDVSIRSQVVRLFMDLQAEQGLAYLFISHDMAVVEQMAHRIAVVYLGQIVEIGPRQQVISNPQHSYTRKLLESVPIPDPARRRDRPVPTGEVPSPMRRVGDVPGLVRLRRVGPDHFAAEEG